LVDKIPINWYQSGNVVELARQLLGKTLCTRIGDEITKGTIVETEAYSGYNDKACHANNQKLTKRNKVMFESGGVTYVYLCYGIHHLFNIVTNIKGNADAVLVRAVQPESGMDIMMKRRSINRTSKQLTAGPGVLSQAFGITLDMYGARLDGDIVWIENSSSIADNRIVSCPRIGVDYAEEDAIKPWRFYIKENDWVSRK